MKLEIRNWPDPVLLASCSPWDFAQPPVADIDQFETNMIDTMLQEQGIGLAANQVGYGFRVIAMHIQANGQIVIMYNPELVSQSQEQWLAPEGCLSFPGIELLISRSASVVARWQDRDGEYHEREFQEIDAKCFMHELDHLNGRVFKDLVSDLKYQRAAQKAQKR